MTPELLDPLGGPGGREQTEEEVEADAARLSEIAREMKRLGVKISDPNAEGSATTYYALGDYGDYQRGNPNPTGLMCRVRSQKGLWFLYLDKSGAWKGDPALADYFFGRNDDSWPITEEEARSLVDSWGFAWKDPGTAVDGQP